MNIYIPIEIKVRELEGKLLLALTAAERGHTVILGDKSNTRRLAARGFLPPGIIHNKSLTPSEKTLKLLEKLKNNGHVVTCQDEESGLLDESYDEFARLRFSEKSISSVERVYTWGGHDTESLKRMFPSGEDRILPTGSPRVDYWRKEFDQYYKSEQKSRLPREKRPFILIASNFGTILNENRFFNVIARSRQAGYYEREEGRERHEYQNIAYQTKLIYEFVVMIRKLSETYSDHTILVRPHPVESIEAWEKIIGEYSNVEVIREGTISGWIRNAEVMIHNGCTTAIESAASGLPRIAYRPIPSEIEREIPNQVSINAFNLDELLSQVDEILETGKGSNEKDVQDQASKILKERFANLTGPLAAEKIVGDWEEIGKNLSRFHKSADELWSVKFTKKKRLKNKLSFLKKFVSTITNFKKTKKQKSSKLLKSGHKFPDFDESEMQKLLMNLQTTLGQFSTITFKKFSEKSYIVYKENN
jgi:surface carbohydrate biosynthesis protein